MNLTPEILRRLLDQIDVTTDHEIDCGQFLDRLAETVEAALAEGAVPDRFAAMIQHMRICPECCEEFEALYKVLREEDHG